MANSKNSPKAQGKAAYKSNIEKLQNAGLIGKVDFRKKATPAIKRKIEKYRSFLAGKESAVQAHSQKEARELRRKFGLKGDGKTIIIPREKGERFHVNKEGEITSTRPNPAAPGTTIKKTIGQKYKPARTGNEKLYYTLPERQRGLGRVKRHTFSSFDEMLYYLNAYEINFDDVEEFIEIEEFLPTYRKAKSLDKKIASERAEYLARKKKRGKKRAAKKRKPDIGHKPRKNDAKNNRLLNRKR